jgi:hypothetical protein
MPMFDYDARPVTPVPVLVGPAASRGAYAIRDFLSRNGYPFEWVDADEPDAVRVVLGVAEVEPSALPLCILPDGSRLAVATVEQVADTSMIENLLGFSQRHQRQRAGDPDGGAGAPVRR